MKMTHSLTIALITIFGCLLIGAAPAHGGTFNVRDYGAKGDDKNDNTAAFSKCMNALIAAGGGKMYIPDGVYQGRIIIPPVSKPLPSWITVEIVGESEPAPVFGTIGDFPLQNKGTIVKCLAESGAAVISAAKSPNSLYGGFSAVYVVVRNLDVRTYDNPGISGVDLTYAMQCKVENAFINTGVYNVQASQPTHGTKGLITPLTNNAALTILRNVVVTGYQTGIVVYEHTDGDNIVVGGNIIGLDFATAHHASRFGRVGAYRNTHHVAVTGKHGFSIEQMNTEQPGSGQTSALNEWQTLVSDVNDPQNLGIADINYWIVVGNKGAVDQFTRIGGASIRTRRIGSATAGNEKTGTTTIVTPTPPVQGQGQGQDQEPVKISVNGASAIKSVSASSQYDAAYDAGKASDGILTEDVQNFWASANGQDVGSWWQADLGEITSISEVQIQFRAFDGSYHFVPKTITLQVSDDGNNWQSVVSKSANVPAIGSAPDGKPHTYELKAKGRYVRLLFEDGTADQIEDVKAVELVEVKVIKAAAR